MADPFIDLAEPDSPAPVGDRVPCHLFMPEVDWPAVLPPVLRTPRRELYLQTVEPWSPAYPALDDLDDEIWRRFVFLVGLGVVLVGSLLVGVLR